VSLAGTYGKRAVDLAEQGVEFDTVEGLALGCAPDLHEAVQGRDQVGDHLTSVWL
jgi:hypothetical protein